MNILLIEKLTKQYGEKILFEDITFGIEKGKKIGLIAKNGSGKTTLLNIIAGCETPDSGKIVIRKDYNLTYLKQEPDFEHNLSIADVLFNTKNIWNDAIRNYEICIENLSINNSEENKIELEKAITEIDKIGAWEYEHKIKEILSKFDIINLKQKIGQLSGGQKKKIAIAKALIENANIIIMDEPTNHLDIDMIEWLEEYLSKNQITLLLVTHDRYFLDKICDEIIELENKNIYQYKGGYEYYLEKKEERMQNETSELSKSKSLYKTELEWIRRMPQARGTKSKARIDAFNELKIKAHQQATKDNYNLSVLPERLGNKIMEINNLNFGFENKILINDFSYIFKRSEKIGIVGPNGCGKSTLIKLIANMLKPNNGKIVVGQTVKIGYYSQEGLKVDENRRVIDIVKDFAEYIKLKNGSELSASQFLNHFGFSYNSQWNYFEKLSGGERRRLFLLLTLCQNPNFLLLDEPTNDFDIETMNILEDFLINFDGCVLVASHDRYLLDKIADHIFCFEENGTIKDFYGSYTEYRFKRKNLQKQISINDNKQIQEKIKVQKIKRSFNEQREFELLESEIAKLENEKTELLEKLNLGNGTNDELILWSNKYKFTEELIETKTNRWLELSDIE